MASTKEFYSRQTVNPLPVLADKRIATAAAGTLAAYMGRKLAYKNGRAIFGFAQNTAEGIKYFAVHPDKLDDGSDNPKAGQINTEEQIPNAMVNRLLYNGATCVGGALIVGFVRDPDIDFFGVGVISGSLANVIMTLLNID